MFRIYFTNLEWHSQETFNDIQEALDYGISKGFDFRVESSDGIDIICAWSIISGTRWYANDPS